MSGITGDNPYRTSGVIAAAASGGLSWQDIVTASTLTAEAGKAYWIDTTSNASTITLPAAASDGDEILFADYDRTWGTNGITIDSNGLNYQGDDDSYTVEYGTDGTALSITYMDATQGWVPTFDDAVADVPVAPSANDNGIFAYGYTGSADTAVSNIISNTGVAASDVAGVGAVRAYTAGCEYGNDKGIMGYGYVHATGGKLNITNLISNTGVIGTDVTGVGTARMGLAAATYGGDKGIFGYGNN